MSELLITKKQDLQNIANNLKTKIGKTDEMSFPNGFMEAIDDIANLKESGLCATPEQLAQIEQNKNDISRLCSEIENQQERISDQGLTIGNHDNKITDLQKAVENLTSLKAEGNTVEEQLAWLAENGDTSKEYLLADGYYYGYVKTTITGKVYTNQVPISKDTDGSIFNGTGWIGQTRLSTSSGTKECDYTSTTGYIPATAGSVIRMKGVSFSNGNDYICAYKSDFTLIGATSGTGSYTQLGTVTNVDGVPTLTLPNNNEIAWIRVSALWSSADPGYNTDIGVYGPCANLIVTVNEEIKEGTVETEAWTNTGKTSAFVGAEEVLILTESELRTLTQEKLAVAYTNGTRIIGVTEDYENLVPKAISESGVVYNGYGYMRGYRLNSSGGLTAEEMAVNTGFIPYAYGKDIRIVGGLRTNDHGGQYVATYNDSFELIKIYYLSSVISSSGGTSVFNDKNIREDIIKTSNMVDSFENVKYIRVSLAPCIGKDMRVSYS